MPWIESHSVIGRHRKFKGLARQLKISIPQAIGHIHLLWHTAIEQAEDGDLSSWTVGAIADSACWEGSEQEFLKAVQDNALMDEQRIHDWLDHAGKYLISKYKTSNHDRLVEIWAKFDKIYGKEVKRNSLVVPLGSPHNLTEHNLTEQTQIQASPTQAEADKVPRKKQPFIIPAVEDVAAYCAERKNKINPKAFMAKYEANGWLVGKNPMKDWKASIRYWEQNDFQSTNAQKPDNRPRYPSPAEVQAQRGF